MPVYQYWCDGCFLPFEILMNLSEKDRYDRGELSKEEKEHLRCPECDKELTYLVAPPKTVRIN